MLFCVGADADVMQSNFNFSRARADFLNGGSLVETSRVENVFAPGGMQFQRTIAKNISFFACSLALLSCLLGKIWIWPYHRPRCHVFTMARRRNYVALLFIVFLYVVVNSVWLQMRSKLPPVVSSNMSPALELEKQQGTIAYSDSIFERLGVQPRTFVPWNVVSTPLPCFEPEENWLGIRTGKTPTREGFLYTKIHKTGSSTASGIHLRIASNIARRQNLEICKNKFRHATARQMKLMQRDKTKSFAWSIVRDPTARAISEFFHLQVARRGIDPLDDNFIKFLNETRALRDFELNFLAMQHIDKTEDRSHMSNVDAINRLLNEYDFLGITERMDESTVALQMLLGLEISDVMSVSRCVHFIARGRFDANE